ncbi:MAG: hypothetical protein HZC03_00775 [Candidatus Lloydbacteria bacterium]|nr:hypothetical protein [Candidatus Lloydbacteria bacterium]
MAFESQKTSFIPKQAIAKTPQQSVRGIGGVTALAIFLAIAAVLAYGGLFIYKSVLNNNIDSLAVSLDRARGAFETNLIVELQTVDARLSTGGMLLKQHSALSPLFSLLEENTVQTLRYKNFSLKTESDGAYSVTLRGEADDYASIALQSDIFSQNKYIKDYIFSNLTLNQDGRISFDFSAKINAGLLSYGQTIVKP